jgi:hypothetical protein
LQITLELFEPSFFFGLFFGLFFGRYVVEVAPELLDAFLDQLGSPLYAVSVVGLSLHLHPPPRNARAGKHRHSSHLDSAYAGPLEPFGSIGR